MSGTAIWKPNVVVAAVIERDGKFLLVEEDADGELVFNQPAGHLDEGESLLHAVVREVKEETAWDFDPTHLIGVYRWQRAPGAVTYLRFCFTGRALRHDSTRKLDTGIVRAEWFSRQEIAAMRSRLRSPLVEQCIDDYAAGLRYPLTLLHDLGA